MARGRKSVTSEYTNGIVDQLLGLGIFDDISISGNTVKLMFNGEDGFKFVPKPLSGGVRLREAKFSIEECINAVKAYISAKGNPSSSKYNVWAKSQTEIELPSTPQVMDICGNWPALAIIKSMMTNTIADMSAQDIIDLQNAIKAEDELETAAMKAEKEAKKAAKEAKKASEVVAE